MVWVKRLFLSDERQKNYRDFFRYLVLSMENSSNNSCDIGKNETPFFCSG